MDRSTAILERFRSLYPREIDLSLDRMAVLLAKLGHPEKRLPPVIHVAGTNGKGSTTAFMRAMLEAAGKSVHVYTSPHLVRFHERIRIGHPGGARFVSEDALIEVFLATEKANAGTPIPQFEIITAAALSLFAERPADFLLLEVGLGGRYDATNVVASPLVSVITPVAMDHEKFFGDSLAQIAGEKAGIVKRGRPVVVAPQQPIVFDVIDTQAAQLGAPVFLGNRDWMAHAEHGRLVYQDEDGLLDLPSPRLVGRHQFTNAGTAIAALRQARLSLPQAAVAEGLASVDWPARLQRLTGGHLAERLGGGELWLDGGHNPSAGAAIAEAMADLEERVSSPLVLIAGMLNTKDPIGFFKPFAGLAQRVLTVPVPGTTAGRDPGELAEAATIAGLPAEASDGVEAALDKIVMENDGGSAPRVLICGSLYLAGAVLAANGTPPG